jgi:hypothetical protein
VHAESPGLTAISTVLLHVLHLSVIIVALILGFEAEITMPAYKKIKTKTKNDQCYLDQGL